MDVGLSFLRAVLRVILKSLKVESIIHIYGFPNQMREIKAMKELYENEGKIISLFVVGPAEKLNFCGKLLLVVRPPPLGAFSGEWMCE